jgi:hypothetical protein
VDQPALEAFKTITLVNSRQTKLSISIINNIV